MTDNDDETDDRRTVANPERGCGHLKHGKAYLRGVVGSEDGLLPSFVEATPKIPFKEVGSDGEFTRGFLRFDGVATEAKTDDGLTRYKPLYPRTATDSGAVENHVKAGLYQTPDAVPDQQWQRHMDRVAYRGSDADHWGNVPTTGTGQQVHTDLLMRVGQTHYDTPGDFIDEAVRLGISKAIPVSMRQNPPEVVPGQTRIWFVHPDACTDGYGVIGYAYLQEVIYTEPVDGNVPRWVQEMEKTGQLEVVDIEDPGPPQSHTLTDWEDGDGPDDEDGDPDVDGGQTEDPVPARPVQRQQTVDDIQAGSDGSDDADGSDSGADGSDADTVVPAGQQSDRDVTAYRTLLQQSRYNTLKRITSDFDVDVGQNPTKDELRDALLDADVDRQAVAAELTGAVSQ